uniref:S1 motif domain-containing protein n=1 Tax=Panagrolaimus sp. ES5 TaxID=591445 RepID=A0AC34GFF9_9BILA
MIMNAQPRPADKPFNTIKDEKEELKAMFPALAMANTANPLADFEGLMGKWEQENKKDEPDSKSRRSRSHSPRRRRRSRSRSNSRERKKAKRDDDDRRHRDRDRRRRSRSREKDHDRRRHRSRSREREHIKLPEYPELGKIYEAKIQSTPAFGAFAQIIGVRQKCDGLIHISQLSKNRVKDVSEVVNRGQTVKVKVVKVDDAGPTRKFGLSMKEVDQRTGADLCPNETPLGEDAVLGMDEQFINSDRKNIEVDSGTQKRTR